MPVGEKDNYSIIFRSTVPKGDPKDPKVLAAAPMQEWELLKTSSHFYSLEDFCSALISPYLRYY